MRIFYENRTGKLDSIKPYEKPTLSLDLQIQEMAKSIERLIRPIVIDENNTILAIIVFVITIAFSRDALLF